MNITEFKNKINEEMIQSFQKAQKQSELFNVTVKWINFAKRQDTSEREFVYRNLEKVIKKTEMRYLTRVALEAMVNA